MQSAGVCALAAYAVLVAAAAAAEPRPPVAHTIYLTAVEFKGSTTADRLLPPKLNPALLSRGYVYKKPEKADPDGATIIDATTWERGREYMVVVNADKVGITC